MGVTNLCNAAQLVERAGTRRYEVALIAEPLQRGFCLDSNPSSAEELELYGDQLLSPISERSCWVQRNDQIQTGLETPLPAPQPLNVPIARITRCLKKDGGRKPLSDELTFVAAIPGLSGANIVKVLREFTAERRQRHVP